MKQLREAGAADPDERKQLAFEAKLGMELNHPNLIRVHEYVGKGEMPYFVMDYFPSNHLRQLIKFADKFNFTPSRIRRVMIQAARGLAYMHDKGWIHRDIKPENILVNKAGETKVIDYALARRPPSVLARLLRIRPPCQGTESYMSPEQILRLPPAVSADIYSYGVTCYEMVTGRQPFRANSRAELFEKHLRAKPASPIVHNPNITPEFADLVLSMLQKDPRKRPESMMAFLSRLRTIRIFKDDPDPATQEA
jgi:serine/threonine protein kinase